jgi:plasmid stability protein
MARKQADMVGLHLRFSEGLRRRLEREAARHDRSMNAEIIDRLEQSFHVPDQATATAKKVIEMMKTEQEIWKYAVKNTEEGSK